MLIGLGSQAISNNYKVNIKLLNSENLKKGNYMERILVRTLLSDYLRRGRADSVCKKKKIII